MPGLGSVQHADHDHGGRVDVQGQFDLLLLGLTWMLACDLLSSSLNVRTLIVGVHGLVGVATLWRVRQNSCHLSMSNRQILIQRMALAGIVCALGAGSMCRAESATTSTVPEVKAAQEPPKSGPIIRTVTRVTQTSLFAQFSGQEVWTIDWQIKTGQGKAVASGTFNPSNSTPAIAYPKLAPGHYTLIFRGQACKTGDEKAFEIQEDPVVRMGVVEKTAGGQIFSIVNGREVRIEVFPSGAVRLIYPETRPSGDGKSPTRAWVMNSYMVPLHADELRALSTTGLKLPEGNHTFYVYYLDSKRVATLEDLYANWWEIVMNPDTYRKHTAGAEYVLLQVEDVKPKASNEIKAPRDIRAVTWYPQYQETTNKLDLPPGKKFGVTKRVAGIPAQRLVEQGTYLQQCNADVNNNHIPYNRTWLTMRAYAKGEASIPHTGTVKAGETVTVDKNGLNCQPGDIISIHKGYSSGRPNGVNIAYSIPKTGTLRFDIKNTTGEDKTLSGGNLTAKYFASVNEEAERLYSGARRGAITASEICENGIPYDQVEQIYRRLYELQVERDGVKNPNDTDIVSDYFCGLYGYGTEFGHVKAPEKRELFSTPENAKKGEMKGAPSRYYAERAYEYRHRLVGGYLDGIAQLLDGKRIYGHIESMEKQYIAMPDRKVLTFGWTGFEGIGSKIESGAIWQRLPLQGGDLIRLTRMEGSFEQLKYETFTSLLIGDYYVSWNDNGQYGTNVNGFGFAHIGGPADWKNLWQPTGGKEVQYNPNNPTQPRSNREGGGWSDGAAAGHNGGFVGAWLLSQIKERIDKSLRYPVFSYSVGGKEYPGYFDGNNPVKGALGNSEVSRFGRGNAGQCNIVNQNEHRKPIIFFGEGFGGACLIVINPFAGLTETTTYQVQEGAGYTVSHAGPYLGVYRLSGQR